MALLALQLAVLPPLLPAHDRAQGPLPHTADAVPTEQRLEVGAVETVVPLADQHTQLIGVGGVVPATQV